MKLQLTPEQWNRLQSLPRPRCPRNISPEAKAIWKATAPVLKRKGHLTFIDAGMFRAYCVAVADHRRAVAALMDCEAIHRKAHERLERITRRMANKAARMFCLPKIEAPKNAPEGAKQET
ncbi:MAG TPA: P27 family phage terminase small subunit [Candidatus Hydrogenedentes bacterium]|nr:P27 family phage terminase small subunit [Candidatus Hydrogenedentota bacterium]